MSARLAQYKRLAQQRRDAIAQGDDDFASALERQMSTSYGYLSDDERAVLSMAEKRGRRRRP